MADAVDPFEEFRKKKEAQKAADKPVIKESTLPPELLEGRPKGFSSHRYDFGQQEGVTPSVPGVKPKGFKTTNVADGPKEGIQPLPRPKGFNTVKIVKKKA